MDDRGRFGGTLRSGLRIDQASVQQSRPFPYRMRAHIEAARDLGGSIGTRATLLLEYQPHAPGQAPAPETVERFSFAEGAGWYAWESTRGSATFDVLGGPVMTRGKWCGDPAASPATLIPD